MPELVRLELDPELGARRARPGDPGPDRAPAPGSTSASTSCPARCRSCPTRERAAGRRLAADVVWFDALVTNVDRTPRNPNLLVWHGRLWLIDHGAALYQQHGRRPLAPRRCAFAADRASTCCCRSPARSPRPTRGWRRGSTPARVEAVVARGAGRVAATARRPARVRRATCARGSASRAASSRRPRRARLAPDPFAYAIAARRPARRARRAASTPASCCSAARRGFLAARTALDERRLRALAPDLDPAAVRPRLDAIERVARGDDGVRRGRRAWSRPSASAGSSRRRAPSSSPREVHTGLTDDPAATLEQLFGELVPLSGSRGG